MLERPGEEHHPARDPGQERSESDLVGFHGRYPRSQYQNRTGQCGRRQNPTTHGGVRNARQTWATSWLTRLTASPGHTTSGGPPATRSPNTAPPPIDPA